MINSSKSGAARYIDAARLGKTDWWRFLLVLCLVQGGSFITGGLVWWYLVSQFGLNWYMHINIRELPYQPTVIIVLFSLSAVFQCAAIVLLINLVHKRSAMTLIRPVSPIRWGRMFAASFLWVILLTINFWIEALLHPGRFQFVFQPAKFVSGFLFSIPFIIILVIGEEFVHRGYFLQWLGLHISNVYLLSLIPSLIITGYNTANYWGAEDFWFAFSYLLLFNFLLAYVTLKDGGLELALGIHFAMNAFLSYFVNDLSLNPLPTPALFITYSHDFKYLFVSCIVMSLVFIFLVFYPLLRKKQNDF